MSLPFSALKFASIMVPSICIPPSPYPVIEDFFFPPFFPGNYYLGGACCHWSLHGRFGTLPYVSYPGLLIDISGTLVPLSLASGAVPFAIGKSMAVLTR